MRALSFTLGVLVLSYAGVAWAWPPLWAEPDALTPLEPSDPFPTPDSLRSAVQFWRDLFIQHTSDRVVVHDRERMDIVWRVIELPKDEAGMVDEVAATKLVRANIQELRERLQRLAADPIAIDEEDRVLIALAGGNERVVAGGVLAGAAERLRTQRGVADHFKAGLERAQQWVPEMRRVLVEEGVPPEIVVLPFVESMFNPQARSSAGAVGLWQLMPGTAKGLGLKVKKEKDDRLDVLAATRGAARMLKQNYRMLGSWPLAITAYNHGPNGVRRAVDLVGSTDLAYLIENYQKSTWGFASKNFYAEFLAALSLVRGLSDAQLLASIITDGGASVRP